MIRDSEKYNDCMWSKNSHWIISRRLREYHEHISRLIHDSHSLEINNYFHN